MKAQYVVITPDNKIRGIIPSKELAKKFELQRNMKVYRLEELKEKRLIDMLHEDSRDTEDIYEFVMFKDEYVELLNQFDQIFMDIDMTLVKLFSMIKLMLNITNEERKIIEEFIKMVLDHLKRYGEEYNEDYQTKDVIDTEARFFNIEEIIKPILGVFDY